MTKIDAIKKALYSNPLHSFALLIGVFVEVSNHNSLFFDFVKMLHADFPFWLNHIIALFFAMFFCTIIITTGFDKDFKVSWFLALLTIVISFGVYNKIGLNWGDTNNYNSVHAAILMVAFLLPILVAYLTHRIAKDINYVEQAKLSRAEEIQNIATELTSIINALPANMLPAKQVRLTHNHSAGAMIEEEEEPKKK